MAKNNSLTFLPICHKKAFGNEFAYNNYNLIIKDLKPI